jgi:hypothetical protein
VITCGVPDRSAQDPTRLGQTNATSLRHDHTIIWELEDFGTQTTPARMAWPNRFSRLVGDKAFGLLIADAVGLPVPAATGVPRLLAPFHFGQTTGTGEFWIRTCPTEQVPGRFTTHRGWLDPFELMRVEDPVRMEWVADARQVWIR